MNSNAVVPAPMAVEIRLLSTAHSSKESKCDKRFKILAERVPKRREFTKQDQFRVAP